jgi:transcriptional regulator with XRE-family HTH domain
MDFYPKNLVELRENLEFSQEQLAEKVGVSQQSIAKWEGGQTPKPEHIRKLAEALQCSTYDISTLAPRPGDPALKTPFPRHCYLPDQDSCPFGPDGGIEKLIFEELRKMTAADKGRVYTAVQEIAAAKHVAASAS